jgi:peptidase M28-like protein
MRPITVLGMLLLATEAGAQVKSINPEIRHLVDSISEDRIAEILKKLESFGTRNIYSSEDDPGQGIGAARRWLYDQFKSYSPRLEVRYDTYRVKKKGRLTEDVVIHNVVAILPGKLNPERAFILSGHYDSLAFKRPPEDQQQTDGEIRYEREPSEPGVTDDGSGTAAVLELARVMSQREFEKTIVFIAFAGEEYGLVGSTLYAQKARKENRIIDGVLNNDIIGSESSGDGKINNSMLWLFSDGPEDSGSRQLARYIKDTGARYVPSMQVNLVFRADRLGRGGDHTPFQQQGYAAVRFTSPNENYANEHTMTDTFANTSVSYAARVIRVNAAALASLALAPKAPVVDEEIQHGPRKGQLTPMIGRGKSHYDAVLRWKNDNAESDLVGYAVVMRSTTAPYWEREVFVGKVNEFTLKDVSIDDVVFGVKAIDKDGNESLVSAYVPRPRLKLEVETF